MRLLPILAAAATLAAGAVHAQPAAGVPPVFPAPATHDGAHDFDFLIGDWKAHVKRLPDRLVGSTKWLEYDGVSRHHKLLNTNANFEEFEVDDPADHQHIKAQTLRVYDPKSRQWAIYGLDLDAGSVGMPATIGSFENGVGRFYDYEDWKGRWLLVRFEWSHTGKDHAHMEQAFSADGGRTWEVNWICDLVREGS